jgi:UDP-N-acetylmuramyl tripeptide synthase
MNIRLTFTIIVSKFVIKACRLFRTGGTSLPGEIARKLYPDIVKIITKGFNTIMVTGTNGKTTTTRIIGQILGENKIEYITNKSGANLVDGVTTTFLDSVDIHGRSTISTALIEIDEAAFDRMTDYLQPNILVVTNFFRDQLDRYGELYSTLNRVKSGIEKSPNVKLILNADDSLCASIGNELVRDTIYFGMASDSYSFIEETSNSDAAFCIYCKGKYEYSFKSYGHLGGFKCPDCSYERPSTLVTCSKIDELSSSQSRIQFNINASNNIDKTNATDSERFDYCAKINLPGLYNVYNALAALACGHEMGLPVEKSIAALDNFECGFGRMETINTEGKSLRVILVKNPTGFNQVLNYLLTEDKTFQLAFIINDKIADGRDISWLWDVEFEKLELFQERIGNIYTSGLRAADMAVRLKYAGIYTNKITSITNYSELINAALANTKEGHNFYILPTYTAMLEIRKELKQKFKLKEFWK